MLCQDRLSLNFSKHKRLVCGNGHDVFLPPDSALETGRTAAIIKKGFFVRKIICFTATGIQITSNVCVRAYARAPMYLKDCRIIQLIQRKL